MQFYAWIYSYIYSKYNISVMSIYGYSLSCYSFTTTGKISITSISINKSVRWGISVTNCITLISTMYKSKAENAAHSKIAWNGLVLKYELSTPKVTPTFRMTTICAMPTFSIMRSTYITTFSITRIKVNTWLTKFDIVAEPVWSCIDLLSLGSRILSVLFGSWRQ